MQAASKGLWSPEFVSSESADSSAIEGPVMQASESSHRVAAASDDEVQVLGSYQQGGSSGSVSGQGSSGSSSGNSSASTIPTDASSNRAAASESASSMPVKKALFRLQELSVSRFTA